MVKTLIKILAIITICSLVISVILVFVAFDLGKVDSAYHSIFNIILNIINLSALIVLHKTT